MTLRTRALNISITKDGYRDFAKLLVEGLPSLLVPFLARRGLYNPFNIIHISVDSLAHSSHAPIVINYLVIKGHIINYIQEGGASPRLLRFV